MENTIFKQVNDITKEEVLKEMQFKDIPDYGDVMSIQKFEALNDNGCIIDYDGSGALVYDNKEVTNSAVWCFNKSVLIARKFILPYDSIVELFGDKASIIWFNK